MLEEGEGGCVRRPWGLLQSVRPFTGFHGRLHLLVSYVLTIFPKTLKFLGLQNISFMIMAGTQLLTLFGYPPNLYYDLSSSPGPNILLRKMVVISL